MTASTPAALLTAAADRLASSENEPNVPLWMHHMPREAAAPLVAWLRRTAASVEVHVPAWERAHLSPGLDQEPMVDEPHDVPKLVEHHFGEALEFARRVLGGEVPA